MIFNLTSLSIGSALLFLKGEIEKSGLGHDNFLLNPSKNKFYNFFRFDK